jgi:heme O synthase-like polyprenyltransferase
MVILRCALASCVKTCLHGLRRDLASSVSHSRAFGARAAVEVPTAASDQARYIATPSVPWGDLFKLAKGKLSLIVVTTAAAGFAAASGDDLDYWKLANTCLGTFGCSAAANAVNQIYEIRNDGMMRRTMLRPLPAGRLSIGQALLFAAVTGVGGTALLATQVRVNVPDLGRSCSMHRYMLVGN